MNGFSREIGAFASKVYYTLREEGVGSVANRTIRYIAYRARRAMVDKGETIARWQHLKGRYAGRRAFLIGNGPSLNRTELYLLRDEFTMVFNRFDLMLERINWTPNFYVVSDDRVLMDILDVANQMARRVDLAFFPDIHPYNVDFRGKIEPRSNVHWLFLDRASFSLDLPYCGMNKTVANVGLQILGFLGFTEIYLVGVDMTYSIPSRAIIDNPRDITSLEDDDDSHFDPRYFGRGRKFHVPMVDEMFAKFEEGRRFFEPQGIRIFNATRGGELEVYPRVDFVEVLGLSEAEIERRFVDNVQSKLRAGIELDVLKALSCALLVEPGMAPANVPSVFAADVRHMGDLLKAYVHRFVPFGPCRGRYLFVERSMVG